MNKPATLHRHLCIIRQLRPPFRYPTKEYLVDFLLDHGFAASSKRTLERDFNILEREYGIKAAYDRDRRGYYLELPTDEDVSDFDEFVKLLERKERMDFLTSSIGKASFTGRYLQLDYNEQFRGGHHLPLLWEALTSRRIISFTYQNYTTEKSAKRQIEPGILFEYRNRWYLAGWDVEAGGRRTFGLDRISNLELTQGSISTERNIDYKNFRQHAIGVTSPPDQPVEQVILRFTKQEGQYVLSLPLHPNQKTVEQNEQYIIIELEVILNHELEREILAYGEDVEVLEPPHLRNKLLERMRKMMEKYAQ